MLSSVAVYVRCRPFEFYDRDLSVVIFDNDTQRYLSSQLTICCLYFNLTHRGSQ